jgi:hypothetical protein
MVRKLHVVPQHSCASLRSNIPKVPITQIRSSYACMFHEFKHTLDPQSAGHWLLEASVGHQRIDYDHCQAASYAIGISMDAYVLRLHCVTDGTLPAFAVRLHHSPVHAARHISITPCRSASPPRRSTRAKGLVKF